MTWGLLLCSLQEFYPYISLHWGQESVAHFLLVNGGYSNRIDRFVDRVLFRKRHLAEPGLERAARSLPHAQSYDYIDDVLVTEASDALELASAAVLRKTETGYARMRAMGWEAQHASALSGANSSRRR